MEDRELLEKYLKEGEKLKWTGRPKEVSVLKSASKGKTFLLWLAAAAWLVVSFVNFLPKMIETDGSVPHMIIVMILIDCIPVLMLSMPFSDCRILNEETLYAITDYRVLIRYKERMISMPLEPDMKAEIRPRDAGTGNILLGTAIGKSDGALRAIALNGLEKDNRTTGMVLYHVTEPQKILTLLENIERIR